MTIQISSADRDAAARILGIETVETVETYLGRGRGPDIVRHTERGLLRDGNRYWSVASSLGTHSYTVEERQDTVNGGMYLFCNCKAWPYQKGKGVDCRHVAHVRKGIM